MFEIGSPDSETVSLKNFGTSGNNTDVDNTIIIVHFGPSFYHPR